MKKTFSDWVNSLSPELQELLKENTLVRILCENAWESGKASVLERVNDFDKRLRDVEEQLKETESGEEWKNS